MSGLLRFGVVGCGRVFQQYHLPALAARPAFAVVAACDLNVASARGVLGDLAAGALVTPDLTEFLEAGRPDVVAVCTPNSSHTVPLLAALAAGRAVLSEKPLAATLADARQIAAAAAGNTLAGVNLPYRFHELLPAFAAALPACAT